MFDADKRGNRDLIAICCMNIVLYGFTYFFYKIINRRRDKIWKSWSTKVCLCLMKYVIFSDVGFGRNNKSTLKRRRTRGINA